MKKTNRQQSTPNDKSQSAMLKRIERSTYIAIIAGIIYLVLFAIITLYSNSSKNEQLKNTVYLNQYRIGSKNLTSAVRTYAVTGNSQYYDDYYKELNDDKNRDIAWNGLKKGHLKSNEWAELEEIASLSNNLVPLEEQAMDAVKNNDLSSAQDLVYGDKYNQTASEISSKTDDCINKIQSRMKPDFRRFAQNLVLLAINEHAIIKETINFIF